MEYIENRILKKRAEKKKCTTLENGIYIDKKIITFARKQPISEIMLDFPDSFEKMPPQLAEIKYPSAFRPQQIFTSGDLSVNMGFSIFQQELKGDGVWILAEHMKESIKRECNGIRFFNTNQIDKIKGCWFDFRSHAMDSDLYNMMLIMPIEDSLLHVTFHCSYESGIEWRDAVILMWESIEKKEEKKNESDKNHNRSL